MNWYKKIAAPLPVSDNFTEDISDKTVNDYYSGNDYVPKGIGSVEKNLQDYTDHRIVDYLGAGSFGIAYLLDNGNVLKVTTDKIEYDNALKLISNHNDGVVNVHDVNVIQDAPRIMFAIELDNVSPLSQEEKLAFDYIVDAAADIDYYHIEDLKEEEWYSPIMERMFLKARDMFIHLTSGGLLERDLHGENVGWKGDKLVVLDLGGFK